MQSELTIEVENTVYLDQLLNETEAAEFLCYSVRALQNWRVRGGGPDFIKVSARSIRYCRRDLIAWRDSHRVSSTSQRPNTAQDNKFCPGGVDRTDGDFEGGRGESLLRRNRNRA
ncbi:helix-turn-helix transcriptional regulator [Minwuia sp.]|uniref:helix-turn-helix transcriptional regulator n=1 Tax=Minwuia sp. TaxID=2493630 RepID=UPI003A8E72BB